MLFLIVLFCNYKYSVFNSQKGSLGVAKRLFRSRKKALFNPKSSELYLLT